MSDKLLELLDEKFDNQKDVNQAAIDITRKIIDIIYELGEKVANNENIMNNSREIAHNSVCSTSDDRIKNNVMRHEYKILSEEDKEHMQKIKDMGLEFHEYLETICPSGGSREIAISRTKIEEAVMWAVKEITQ